MSGMWCRRPYRFPVFATRGIQHVARPQRVIVFSLSGLFFATGVEVFTKRIHGSGNCEAAQDCARKA
jgi:hypothetical protein